jgi:D-sedoheptulose 7-phosphate isomerase
LELKKEIIKNSINSHLQVVSSIDDKLIESMEVVSSEIISCFERGNKLLICGNGGSAADAQHFSAELVGRFVKERMPLPSFALTTDTSALTAIGNDYSFEDIFSRQVAALAVKGDIILGISTSGKSKNVLKAFEMGKIKSCLNIGFSGNGGGEFGAICDYNIVVPSKVTARIQEIHILTAHIICEMIDSHFTIAKL